MTSTAQTRAVQSHRRRLAARGIVRFELKARENDRDLLRRLARKLADDGPDADALRRSLNKTMSEDHEHRGGILAAFLHSPFAGSELDLSHPFEPGRVIDL